LTKGTKLGELHTIQIMDEVPIEAPVSVRPEDATNEEKEAIDKLMTKLPEDITNEQRKRVKALLFRYQSIISTGKHDIGRTNLWSTEMILANTDQWVGRLFGVVRFDT